MQSIVRSALKTKQAVKMLERPLVKLSADNNCAIAAESVADPRG